MNVDATAGLIFCEYICVWRCLRNLVTQSTKFSPISLISFNFWKFTSHFPSQFSWKFSTHTHTHTVFVVRGRPSPARSPVHFWPNWQTIHPIWTSKTETHPFFKEKKLCFAWTSFMGVPLQCNRILSTAWLWNYNFITTVIWKSKV